MRHLTKLLWIDVALLAAVPIACAAEGTPEEAAPGPDAATEAGVQDDAASDARAEASPCAGALCTQALPTDEDVKLTAIWGSSANDVWAVGSGGSVLHFDGTKWEKAMPAAARADASAAFTLRSVWLERPDDVWMADGHSVRHTNGWKGPSATEWSFVAFPANQCTTTGLSGRGDMIWLARGLGSSCPWQLGRFDGWGATAETYRFASPGLFLPAIATVSLAVTRSDEGWASLSWRPPSGLSGSKAGNRVFRIHRPSDDGGAPEAGPPAWQIEEYDSRTQRTMVAVWGNDDVVWLAGEGGTLRRLAHADVATKRFEVVPSVVTSDLSGIFGFSADDIWAVGEASTVLHWNGKSWSMLPTPFDAAEEKPHLRAVWGSSPNDVWIVGDRTLLHYQGNAP